MNGKEILRKGAYLGAGALALYGGLDIAGKAWRGITATAQTPNSRPADGYVPTPTVTVVPRVEGTVIPTITPTVTATVTPKATEVAGGVEIPDRVDAKNVDTAKGAFKNTIGLGSEMILAEPGVLKVGWDFPKDQFEAAGEHIYRYDPGNQEILKTPESFVNVPEGAFAMFNGNAMTIEVSGNGSTPFRLEIGGPENNHNIVVMRGLYPDGTTPADRNRIAHVTNYTPGAVLYDMYPRGGFVSERQVQQIADNALANDPDCGAEGCRTVTAYFLDLNTGAYAVIAKSQGQPWTAVASNWR